MVVTLVALLLISSTLALIYYSEYQQSASKNNTYAGQLGAALASYNSLARSYDASLADYNSTLNLLATAVANLNTSTPAYRNASIALSTLWGEYERLAEAGGRKALTYVVHILVDFGNGTRRWYNGTSVQPGWNGYVDSLVLLDGRIQGIWYPQYGEHYVTGVDGVSQTPSTSWFVWQFGGGKWMVAETGADQVQVSNGTSIAWTLCGYDSNFNPGCSP